MNWNWVWWFWIGWFFVWEGIGLFSPIGHTFTYFIEHHLPRWTLALIIGALGGWLFYHFTEAAAAVKLSR